MVSLVGSLALNSIILSFVTLSSLIFISSDGVLHERHDTPIVLRSPLHTTSLLSAQTLHDIHLHFYVTSFVLMGHSPLMITQSHLRSMNFFMNSFYECMTRRKAVNVFTNCLLFFLASPLYTAQPFPFRLFGASLAILLHWISQPLWKPSSTP